MAHVPGPFAAAAALIALSFLASSCATAPKSASGAQEKRVQAVQKAATLLDQGKADAAAGQLGELAAASPSDPDLKLVRAAALVSAGKLDQARTEVDAILTTDPANIRALTMGAELAKFADDEKARLSYLNRTLAAAPNDAAVQSAWGEYFLDSQSWVKADDAYRRALASDPKSADAALGLGRALYREEKYPESEAQLTAAIALEPASLLAYSDRSRARSRQGKFTEAQADLDLAVSKGPNESWLYLDRGRFLLDRGKPIEAKADFDRAIALEPEYFLAYTFRGGILEQAGKDAAALDDYRAVIRLYPAYWYAFESAGAAAFRLGLWAESAADFKQAFSASGNRYEYAIASALASWRAGKPKDAAAFAGSIAPTVDRDKNGVYWAMFRLIQDQNDSSAELELKIQSEKKLDLKSSMLFYISEYWICRGKSDLAAKYLSLAADMKRQNTLEYNLILAERKRMGMAQNG